LDEAVESGRAVVIYRGHITDHRMDELIMWAVRIILKEMFRVAFEKIWLWNVQEGSLHGRSKM
jgi:hypothetical protein